MGLPSCVFDSQQLFELVESRGEQLVGLLCDLVRFETVSPFGSGDSQAIERFEREMRRCLDYLSNFAARHNLTFREHPAGVAVIEWGSGDEAIGFCTHLDVVPAGDRWTYPPFEAIVVDDKVYGRGTQDNKGPAACGLIALLAIRALDCPTRCKIRLIFGTHEEGGDWRDISAYLASASGGEVAPVNCIVPDAIFPIINAEKGMATLKFEPAALVLPQRQDGFCLDSVAAGERANIVPDRAVVRLSGPRVRKEAILAQLNDELTAYAKASQIFVDSGIAVAEAAEPERFTATITFLGKSSHGSRPHEGHNAAVDALGYVVRLGFPQGPVMDFVELSSRIGKDLSGSYLGIAQTHGHVGPTTVSLNIFNLNSTSAQAQVNIRHTLGQSSAQVLECAKQSVARRIAASGHPLTVEFEGAVHEPLFTDPQLYPELFGALRQAYEVVTGRPATLLATGGTTYAKGFPRAVCFGPVDEQASEPDMSHKADEFVTRSALLRNAKIYAHALASLCSS